MNLVIRIIFMHIVQACHVLQVIKLRRLDYTIWHRRLLKSPLELKGKKETVHTRHTKSMHKLNTNGRKRGVCYPYIFTWNCNCSETRSQCTLAPNLNTWERIWSVLHELVNMERQIHFPVWFLTMVPLYHSGTMVHSISSMPYLCLIQTRFAY